MGEREKKTLREASVELKQDIAEFIEKSSIAFTIADSEGKFIYFNKGAEALTEWKRAEILGKPLEFVYPAKEEFERLNEILAKKGKFEDEPTYILTKNGKKIPISLSVSKIGTRGSLGVSINRSDQAILFGGLEKKNEEVEFLLDVLAHDITNINFLLLANLEYIEDQVDNSEIQKFIRSTIAQLKRGSRLVRNIQNLLKEQSEKDGNKEDIDLSSTIENLVNEIRLAFPQTQIELNSTIPSKTTLRVDPLFNDLLYSIISNCIQNRKTKDYILLNFGLSSKEKTIDIYVNHKGRTVQTLAGMRPAISLSVARKIIENYGGAISFEIKGEDPTEMENQIILHLPKAFVA
ncbi:MAG: PAS domain-containing protein [Candidatus Hodarchaeota archaeon]